MIDRLDEPDSLTDLARRVESMSDERIARQLVDRGYLISSHFEVWLRQQHGETIYSLRHDFPQVHYVTLYDWVKKVNQAIADARTIDAPEEPEVNPFGITVAVSHLTHKAQDNTPQPHRRLRSLYPDAERMKVYGKKPR